MRNVSENSMSSLYGILDGRNCSLRLRARHGRSEEQRGYYQAKTCFKKTRKKRFESILHRFQTCDICRSSQTNIEWTERFCKHLAALAKEDHSYVASRQEQERYEKVWSISLNSQGPFRSRAAFREVKPGPPVQPHPSTRSSSPTSPRATIPAFQRS